MIIYQGNTYMLPFKLKINGQPIIADDVKMVEFAFGEVIKTYPEHATFGEEVFIVPLTQEETFSFSAKEKNYFQVRVFFNDESVKGTKTKAFEVQPSVSKVVLK